MKRVLINIKRVFINLKGVFIVIKRVFLDHWWALGYSIILAGCAVLVLLDRFFIAKAIQVVDTYTTTTKNSTVTTAVDNGTITTTKSISTATTTTENSTTYTGDIEITDNSYKDENISITITTERVYDTEVYIADIQLSSIDYLKTAFANNTFGLNIKQKTSVIADAHDAIFASNGDFYGYRDNGIVIRNGVLYRDATGSDNEALIIYEDGSFEVFSESGLDAEELIENGAVQAFSFGPSLISNGEITVTTNSEVDQSKTSNPRTAIGIISPLHYIIIVSDGRTDASTGLTLYQLAEVFKEQGCELAYNLDGGGSSTMWFNGSVVNIPTDGSKLGERKVSDIVYIGY